MEKFELGIPTLDFILNDKPGQLVLVCPPANKWNLVMRIAHLNMRLGHTAILPYMRSYEVFAQSPQAILYAGSTYEGFLEAVEYHDLSRRNLRRVAVSSGVEGLPDEIDAVSGSKIVILPKHVIYDEAWYGSEDGDSRGFRVTFKKLKQLARDRECHIIVVEDNSRSQAADHNESKKIFDYCIYAFCKGEKKEVTPVEVVIYKGDELSAIECEYTKSGTFKFCLPIE